MKKLLFTLSLMVAGLITFAQAPLQKGEMQLNAGFGFSNYGLPVYGGAEYGVGNNITVGGELAYRNHSEKYMTVKWKENYTTIAGFGNYHFNELLQIPSNFDVYAGATLGYTIFNSKIDDGSSSVSYSGSGSSGLYLNGQIGGRYFFTDKIGVNLEFGGGNYFSGGKIGITFIL
ncbi:MAG: outer membrane beta-barrel protein [Draconibacterium sp.]